MPSPADVNREPPQNPVVQLKAPRRGGHPWVFQRALVTPSPRPPAGAIADLLNPDGSFEGRGFYNHHARIGFRVLETNLGTAVDRDWFAARLDRAIALRRDVLHLDAVTDAYRLVHAEGDALGGLVVDRFADQLVIEWYAAGMWRQRAQLADLLRERFPSATIHAFADRHVQKQESFDAGSVISVPAVDVQEHGIRYRVQAGSGHKTGFFADQRDNRARLAAFCEGRSVLDLCCNAGGFAISAALRGGAREVVGIDRDPVVIAQAIANAALNGLRVGNRHEREHAEDGQRGRETELAHSAATIEFFEADLFATLDGLRQQGRTFDVVVLDPSKQTRDANRIEQALANYYRMNLLAMEAVAPGGVLLTCSCTGLIGSDVFLETLRRAARAARRTLQILDVQGAAPDHPVLADVPESRYLKAVFCRVL